MSGIGKFIYDFDQGTFHRIQDLFGSSFADTWMVYIGNLYFWTPVFAFALVALYLSKPKSGMLNLLFAAGSFVLAYQAASLLGRLFGRHAPFLTQEIFLLRPIPPTTNDTVFSLPDWAMAAFVALLFFAHMRVRESRRPFPVIVWSLLVVPIIARIYAGYSYPLDIIFGILLGIVIGQFMVHFARNVEIVMAERR